MVSVTYLFKNRVTAVVLIFVIFGAGCSSTHTSTSQYEGLESLIATGDYSATIAQLEAAKGKQYKEKEKVLYYLDLGMLYHFAGNYAKSNELLEQAEMAMEELFTKSVSKMVTSLLLNDNALDYSGEDYEDIYLNVFKALNYLELKDNDAAFVEINRIDHKLAMLQDKYVKMGDQLKIAMASAGQEKGEDVNTDKLDTKPGDVKFHNDALGRYLSVLLYASDREWDNARLDYQKMREAWTAQGNIYRNTMPEVAYSKSDYADGSLSVLSFIGKGPEKKAADYYITTYDNYVNVASSQPVYFSQDIPWPSDGDKHFKFSLPYINNRGTQVSTIEVMADGTKVGELRLLESMESVAAETFKTKAPLIYLKSVARTIIKGFAAEKAKEKLDKVIENPFAAALAKAAADIAVDATENADLRISRFFPAKSYIGFMKLAPGNHTITIRYISSSGTVLRTETRENVVINPGQLNLVQTSYLQ